MVQYELFSTKWLIVYLLIINGIGLTAMLIDKLKAERGSWRIPEKTLFMITLLGGGVGTITGMYLFRHKTKKIYFTFGFPVILICETVLLIYSIIKFL